MIRTLKFYQPWSNIIQNIDSLIINPFLYVDRILLGIGELSDVIEIKDDLLPRRQCGRVEFKGENGDLSRVVSRQNTTGFV